MYQQTKAFGVNVFFIMENSGHINTYRTYTLFENLFAITPRLTYFQIKERLTSIWLRFFKTLTFFRTASASSS